MPARKTWPILAALCALGIVITVGSYFAAQQWASAPAVDAEPRPGPQSDADITPLPTPLADDPIDTSRDGWALPYLAADRVLARVDQELNGIAVGPSSQHVSSGTCAPGEATWVSPDDAIGTPLEIRRSALPTSAAAGDSKAVRCGSQIVHTEATYEVLAASDFVSRVRNGESWFDLEHGGQIQIYRDLAARPGFESSIASERWEALSVNGLPAVVGHAVLRDELGESAVVVWNPDEHEQTVVRGFNIELAVLLRIAEELIK